MFQRERSVLENRSKNVENEKNKPLSLERIEKYLRNSKTYLGAFYLDSFKNFLIKKDKFSLIFYCDNHWFCIFSSKDSFEIFDPLGFLKKKECFSKYFLKFLKVQIGRKVLYANPKIQSDKSNACGYFVVFFILNRELGYSFNEILSKFTKSYPKNQLLVKHFVNKLYK